MTVYQEDGRRRPVETIDANSLLSSRWYGPDSVACHIVNLLEDGSAEAEFTVPLNLCGPSRPSLIDSESVVIQDGVDEDEEQIRELRASLLTTPGHAKEHFNEKVGQLVVPGHNITGAVVEALTVATQQRSSTRNPLYLSRLNFIRYKGFVIPGQQLQFGGEIEEGEELVYSPEIFANGERKAMGSKFRLTEGPELSQEELQRVLAQHWLIECGAQAFGIVAARKSNRQGIVPVLMEVGQSMYASVPIMAGDNVKSYIRIRSQDNDQCFGDVVSRVGTTEVATQQGMLIRFMEEKEFFDAVRNSS